MQKTRPINIVYRTRRDARHVSRLDSLSHFSTFFFFFFRIADLLLGAAAVLTHLVFSQAWHPHGQLWHFIPAFAGDQRLVGTL